MKVSFVDEADIVVESGSGGKGSVHFRRARFLPKGGPDGGDGGRGGDVILVAQENLSDLSDYLHKRFFKAESGAPGGRNKQHGRDGADLRLTVPVGTQLFESETEEMLCDLDTPDMQYVVVRGGRGGKGNTHYKNPVRQAPRIAQNGLPGRRVTLHLVYKIMADVGIVGSPNAGKSLFLSRISSASAKVASYPCTTQIPQLGVYCAETSDRFTFVEVPALAGKRDFLKHVERTHLLLIMIGLTEPFREEEILKEVQTHLTYIMSYGHGLIEKPIVLVLNKLDLLKGRDRVALLIPFLEGNTGREVFPISALTGEGVENLLKVITRSCKVEPE